MATKSTQWEIDLQLVAASLTAAATIFPPLAQDVAALVQLVFGGQTLTADQRATLQNGYSQSVKDALAPLPQNVQGGATT
jgi:hypothetical protein